MMEEIKKLVFDQLKTYFGFIDIVFPVAIIVVIQMVKRFVKIPLRFWSAVMIVLGFGAAFLKVVPFDITQFIIQGIVYSAICELGYQGYKKAMSEFKNYKVFKGKGK